MSMASRTRSSRAFLLFGVAACIIAAACTTTREVHVQVYATTDASAIEASAAPQPSEKPSDDDDDDKKTDDDDAKDECAAKLSGDCGSCMKTSCCDALRECESDTSCAACVSGKDGDACEKTEETHERVDAYLKCKGGSCKSKCIVSDSDAGTCKGLLDGDFDKGCVACLEKSCCSEVSACKDEKVCWDGCLHHHDEAKCHGSPDGHALFHALSACYSSKCSAECG